MDAQHWPTKLPDALRDTWRTARDRALCSCELALYRALRTLRIPAVGNPGPSHAGTALSGGDPPPQEYNLGGITSLMRLV